MKLYQQLANLVGAVENCRATGNSEWFDKHQQVILTLVKDHMPSGSGFDNGTHFDWEASRPWKLVFTTAFHHMNDAGMYDGWTEHSVIATPDFVSGFQLRVTGRNRREIKDYIADCFQEALCREEAR